MDIHEPVVAYTVKDPMEAEIIRSFLKSKGIPCTIGGEHQIGLAGVMDIEIIVRSVDADRVHKLLEAHDRAIRERMTRTSNR
jgi:hypothetical protein